jgi:hypothetical protein
MQDHNSVGRLTSLSPVTWVDGWPYFGLRGNLTRTPKTWVMPNTGHVEPVSSPYERSDDFNRPTLHAVWQWNHLPDDTRWSLTERPGFLRLHSLPARDFWWARNSLTQRAIGPESAATTDLDASGLQPGDVAGLALLNLPYAWIGVRRSGDGFALAYFDQTAGDSRSEKLVKPRLKLRVHCNFDLDTARFSYSVDGHEFKLIGGELKLPFQLKTFQGVRYALFHYNENAAPGGQADFDDFVVDEPRPRGLTKPIPYNHAITLADLANGNVLAVVDGEVRSVAEKERATAFRIVDRGLGRVALLTESGTYLSVAGIGGAGDVKAVKAKAGDAETFQWVDLQRGDTMLLSLVTYRYIVAPPGSGPVAADHAGPAPDRKDGSCFEWRIVR